MLRCLRSAGAWRQIYSRFSAHWWRDNKDKPKEATNGPGRKHNLSTDLVHVQTHLSPTMLRRRAPTHVHVQRYDMPLFCGHAAVTNLASAPQRHSSVERSLIHYSRNKNPAQFYPDPGTSQHPLLHDRKRRRKKKKKTRHCSATLCFLQSSTRIAVGLSFDNTGPRQTPWSTDRIC